MIKKIAAILTEKKGAAVTQTALVVMVMMFLFSIVFLYARVTAITSGVRDTVRNAVIDAVNANNDLSFTEMRVGYTGAYETDDGENWQDASVDGNVDQKVSDMLSLNDANGTLTKTDAQGTLQYSISQFSTSVQNANFGSADSQLTVKTTYMLTVPVSFFLVPLPDMTFHLSASAEMEPKF